MDSIWTKTAKKPQFEALHGAHKTDVLIIGGGLTGLLCAYCLRQEGVDCMVAEAEEICSGVTANTTAKISKLHGAIYENLLRRFGEEKVRLYFEAQDQACLAYERICREIDCDYEKRDAYLYSRYDRAVVEREAAALQRLGQTVEVCKLDRLPFSAVAVRMAEQAQFHPLKFAYAISEQLPVYEHTKAVRILPHRVITQHGEIRCRKIIVATHFPILNRHGGYFLKMYQNRSYVLALADAPEVRGMYMDADPNGLSFRNAGQLLLLGGGAHRTGKQNGNLRALSEFAAQQYPKAKTVARWAAQDCMTLDELPYIGAYSEATPDLFVATGFQKWGMSSAMVAAQLLTNLVQERPNDHAAVFDPSRRMLWPQLAVNVWETLLGFLRPTAPRCPHLGCALKYNAAEHSWDCSCHGSRFSEDGKRLDTPAVRDMKRR